MPILNISAQSVKEFWQYLPELPSIVLLIPKKSKILILKRKKKIMLVKIKPKSWAKESLNLFAISKRFFQFLLWVDYALISPIKFTSFCIVLLISPSCFIVKWLLGFSAVSMLQPDSATTVWQEKKNKYILFGSLRLRQMPRISLNGS